MNNINQLNIRHVFRIALIVSLFFSAGASDNICKDSLSTELVDPMSSNQRVAAWLNAQFNLENELVSGKISFLMYQTLKMELEKQKSELQFKLGNAIFENLLGQILVDHKLNQTTPFAQVATKDKDFPSEQEHGPFIFRNSIHRHDNWVYSAEFSPDGKFIASSSTKIPIITDALTGDIIQTLVGHKALVSDIKYNSDGTQILTGSHDETAKLWDLKTGSVIANFRVFLERKSIIKSNQLSFNFIFSRTKNKVNSVSISADGKSVAIGSSDGFVRIFDVKSKKCTRRFTVPQRTNQWVRSIAFSHSGAYIAAAFTDGHIVVWNTLEDKQILIRNDGIENLIHKVAFNSNDEILAIAGSKHTYTLNIKENKKLIDFVGHTNDVQSIQYSRDDSYILTASSDRTARLWDSQTGKQLEVYSGHISSVRNAVFSKDGKKIATSSDDSTIRVMEQVPLTKLLEVSDGSTKQEGSP